MRFRILAVIFGIPSLVLWAAALSGSWAVAQDGTFKSSDKVQLGDIEIKGEANSDAFRLTQRNRHNLNEKLKLRHDFSDRVLENAPTEWEAPTAENNKPH